MIRKTFASRPEAEQYLDGMVKQGHIVILGTLGDKFRVYGETKEEYENMKSWRRETWAKQDSERYLRKIAYEAKDAVSDALALKKSMESGEIYNDYESSIEAARIMENQRELKTAGDVFNFIDNPSKYDKVMKNIIEATMDDYDYEGKEEIAKE